MQIATYFYNMNIKVTNKEHYPWCTNRIIFHSIRIYDKYLEYYFDNKLHETRKIDQITAHYCYTVCLYLSIKYFSTIIRPPSFRVLITMVRKDLATDDHMKTGEDFEWFLLTQVLKFKFYSQSLFEIADEFSMRLNETQFYSLLNSYVHADTLALHLKDYFIIVAKQSNIYLGPENKYSVTNTQDVEDKPEQFPKVIEDVPIYNNVYLGKDIDLKPVGQSARPLVEQNPGLQTAHKQ